MGRIASDEMRIALFTHHFLEPTHHAIAQVLARMSGCTFWVFAKRFSDDTAWGLRNVIGKTPYTKGPLATVSRREFDLVHAIFDGKTVFRAAAIAKESGIPLVISFHGGFDIHAKIRDPRYRDPVRKVAQEAAAITVVCDSDVQRLRNLGIHREVEVLPVAIDPVLLKSTRNPSARDLLFVGRLIPKKGVDIAIAAMPSLTSRNLSIVGEGPLRAELEMLARRHNVAQRVQFFGLTPLGKTLELMAESFALVHPARVAADGNAEGTPQAILWAQALGLPVVTTNTGSIGDIVADGMTGLLIPPDDPNALAAAIQNLEVDRLLMGRLSRQQELGRHRIDRTAMTLRQIYSRVCPLRANELLPRSA